jgi:hypothetical protein
MYYVREIDRAATPAPLPSRRPFTVASMVEDSVDSMRDDLVRYFAWGYLSRPEVSERLALLERPVPRRRRTAA